MEEQAKSKEEIKKSQNLMFGMALFIIFGIIVFLFFYPVDKPEDIKEIYTYNNYEFFYENGLWSTNIVTKNDVYQLFLHYWPEDLEDIETDYVDTSLFLDQTVFLTFDPTSDQQSYIGVAAVEIGSNLYRVMNSKIYASCLINTSDCIDRPIIDCNSTNMTVVKVIIDNETKVSVENNCVTISGNEKNLIKAADRFLFQLYKIMD